MSRFRSLKTSKYHAAVEIAFEKRNLSRQKSNKNSNSRFFFQPGFIQSFNRHVTT